MAMELGGQSENEQVVSVYGELYSHHGHCLLVSPGVLNLQAKLAVDTVQRECITKREWMRFTGGEKPQADA